MNKIIFIGILFSLVGISIIPISGFNIEQSTDNTLYVGGGGPGNYTNIQDAIDNSSFGDTVFVYDDSSPYYENVVINNKINLFGEDRNSTIIDGKNRTVIQIYASEVYISGFMIQNGYHGIDIRSEYNTIIDNNILFNKYNGIETRSSSGNNIICNYILINSNGIVIMKSTSNIIFGNTISENNRGIDLYYSSNNTITDNKIIYNEASGVSLFVEDNHDNIISSNIISNNGILGIISEGYNSNRTLIIDNNISSNYEAGVVLYNSNDNIVSGNNIIKNGYAMWNFCSGMCLYNCTNNTIIGNNLRLNYIVGIRFRESNNNTISENNFVNNMINAFFIGYCKNTWKQNYWNRPRLFPKLIFGVKQDDPPWIPCLPDIDLNPAQEPYDI